MARLIACQEQAAQALAAIAEGKGKARQAGTIKVEPRVDWPVLGGETKKADILCYARGHVQAG